MLLRRCITPEKKITTTTTTTTTTMVVSELCYMVEYDMALESQVKKRN